MTDVYIDTDSCPRCGDTPIVTTTAKQDDSEKPSSFSWLAYDGDMVRCCDSSCDATGQIAICGENDNGDALAHVSWDDEA